MSRRPRVGIAGVFHESNTFVQRPMTLGDFRDAWHEGDEIVAALAGTQTVTGGFIDGASSCGFDLAPAVHVWGMPAGLVTRPAFDALCDALRSGLEAAGRLDGLLLELHGAMVADGVAAADGVLARLAAPSSGDTPIVAVIDPHANISAAVVDSVDALIAYRTNPHVDMSERGAEAAALLGRILSGACRPYVAATRVPVIAPAIAQATGDEPLASLLAQARALERRHGVLSASVAFGFAYADVPEVAMAAIVVSDGDRALARGACPGTGAVGLGSAGGLRAQAGRAGGGRRDRSGRSRRDDARRYGRQRGRRRARRLDGDRAGGARPRRAARGDHCLRSGRRGGGGRRRHRRGAAGRTG